MNYMGFSSGMPRSTARWRVASVHCAGQPAVAPAAPSPSADSGNCSDASSSEVSSHVAGVWSPLAAYAPPAPGPLRRCSATREPSREPTRERCDNLQRVPHAPSQFEDHFVRRMDDELARIREAPVKIQNDHCKCIITLDVNIFRAEDIQLIASPGRLTVVAAREAYVDASRSVVRRFVRKVALPDSVATDALATRLDACGILTITMLKLKDNT